MQITDESWCRTVGQFEDRKCADVHRRSQRLPPREHLIQRAEQLQGPTLVQILATIRAQSISGTSTSDRR